MKARRIGPGPYGPTFLALERVDQGDLVHLRIETTSSPGSSSFATAVETLVERLEEKFSLWVLTFPEEGDAPLAPASHTKVHASFADGRWYTELKARAKVVDLRRNRDLIYTLFLQDEGALIAVPREDSYTAVSMARLLDGAPDQGTMAWILEKAAFVAYALDLEIHLKSRRSLLIPWILKRLP